MIEPGETAESALPLLLSPPLSGRETSGPEVVNPPP